MQEILFINPTIINYMKFHIQYLDMAEFLLSICFCLGIILGLGKGENGSETWCGKHPDCR